MPEQETDWLNDHAEARSIGSILNTLPAFAALRRDAIATINFVKIHR